jgi:hypothetical protein
VAAFESASQGTQILLRLYCNLISIELRLKDARPQWQSGHDIGSMLADIGEAALSVQLRTKLSALKCTARDGTEVPVDPAQYPHIRYLRHETDFPGAVKDADLDDAVLLIPDILLSMRNKGIL